MRVAELMQPKVKTVGSDATVAEAIVTLADAHISGMPVVDGAGKVIGIVSATDLLAAEAEAGDPTARQALFENTPVRDIMTTAPLYDRAGGGHPGSGVPDAVRRRASSLRSRGRQGSRHHHHDGHRPRGRHRQAMIPGRGAPGPALFAYGLRRPGVSPAPLAARMSPAIRRAAMTASPASPMCIQSTYTGSRHVGEHVAQIVDHDASWSLAFRRA